MCINILLSPVAPSGNFAQLTEHSRLCQIARASQVAFVIGIQSENLPVWVKHLKKYFFFTGFS